MPYVTTLIIAIACFLYGAYALLTAKLFAIDLKPIAEEHRKLYARLIGTTLLLAAAILGIWYYLKRTGSQPGSPVLFLFLWMIPLAIFFVSRKIFRKKGD